MTLSLQPKARTNDAACSFFLLEGNCCQHGDSERWLQARGGAQASRLPLAASRRLGPQLLVHISVTVVPSIFTSWLHQCHQESAVRLGSKSSPRDVRICWVSVCVCPTDVCVLKKAFPSSSVTLQETPASLRRTSSQQLFPRPPRDAARF